MASNIPFIFLTIKILLQHLIFFGRSTDFKHKDF